MCSPNPALRRCVSLPYEFSEAWGNLSSDGCRKNTGAAWVRPPRPHRHDEFPAGYSWRVALRQRPLPLHQPRAECATVVLPVENLSANGQQCLIRLSQLRVPPQAFTTGLNWVESNEGDGEGTFSWHPAYSEFEHNFEFSEQRNSEGVHYHNISVTLHSVPAGNVRTRAITREEFLKGHRHVAAQR